MCKLAYALHICQMERKRVWQVGEANKRGSGVGQAEPVGRGKGLKQTQNMKGSHW